MADRVEITDKESAQAWLNKQDRRTRVWFASRAALRALPSLGSWNRAIEYGITVPALRASMVAYLAGTAPIEYFTDLAHTANFASQKAERVNRRSEFLGGSAEAVAHSASASAASVFSPSSEFAAEATASAAESNSLPSDLPTSTTALMASYSAASRDTGNPMSTEPLWNGLEVPERIKNSWSTLQKQFNEDKNDWSFWIEWYNAILNGNPLDWKLCFRIATKINEVDWDAGQARVAERMKEIQADYLSERTKLHETIELNPETGKFRVVPAELQNPTLTSALLSRVEDCLDDALSGNNGLTTTAREVKTLRRTIQKYANDPQRMELDFTSVAVSLRRQIYDTGELATSEDNLALLESTEEGALGLRANYPEIAENRNRLAQQALSEMSRDDLELLEEAQPVLVALSEGQMAEDFERDIPQLINDALTPLPSGAPPLPGANEATRIFYRTSRMATLYAAYQSGTKRGAELFDSPEVKTIRLVGVCGGVGTVLWNIIKIGLRAFGVL